MMTNSTAPHITPDAPASGPTLGPRFSPTLILSALIGGMLAGLALAHFAPGRVESVTSLLDIVGALWLRALQMTIVPLVVSLLISGIMASVAAARAGRLASWSVAIFMAFLWAGTIMAALVTPWLLSLFPIPEAAASALAGQIAQSHEAITVPPFAEFIKAMVPTNPIAAAANDSILPLILFTTAFAFAITRLEPRRRDTLADLFAAVGDAMLVIIGWVLAIAPIGVAALAFVIAARTGIGAIGVFLHYILIVSAIGVIIWLLAYPVAIFGAGRRLLDFTRAAFPSQAVALSTQSSLASLPAMLRGTTALGVPVTTADVTLPLAVAIFRATSPAMNLAVAIYVAHLTGVPLTPGTLMIGVAVAATTTLGSVSLPGSISFISAIAPICLAMGVPIEPLALLVAVETLPDIIRTLGNVTMDVAVTATVDRIYGGPADEPAQ